MPKSIEKATQGLLIAVAGAVVAKMAPLFADAVSQLVKGGILTPEITPAAPSAATKPNKGYRVKPANTVAKSRGKGKSGTRALTKALKKSIKEHRASGRTIVETADILGVSRSSVVRHGR